MARGRGAAAARVAAAKTFVRERLGQSAGPRQEAAAAACQGISPRYLRRLLTARGESFSGYVLEQRLRRAHAMLTAHRFRHEAVSDIAYDVGFGDLSYFNRAFRRRFECTPREARFEARETPGRTTDDD